jgi:hypothetical protein
MPASLSHSLFVLALWLGLSWAAPAQAQTPPSALPTFNITVKDGVFMPNRLEVPAGQRIKLMLKNAGRGPLEFENINLHVEKILAAGAESFVVVKLSAGEHRFVDEFNIATGELLVIAR